MGAQETPLKYSPSAKPIAVHTRTLNIRLELSRIFFKCYFGRKMTQGKYIVPLTLNFINK